MVKTWRRGLLGAVLLTAAVASAEPPPSNSAQGTQLHGTGRFESINIPLATVEVPAPPAGVTCAPAKALAMNGRLITAQGCSGGNPPVPARFMEGPSLVNATFQAPFEGRTVKLVIEEARCHEDITPPTAECTPENLYAGKARWEYRVTASTEDKNPEPLCPTGSGFALPVPHAWSAGGELIRNPDYFTFACAPKNEGSASQPFFVGGGVIAKCVDWGYPPWATEYPESQALAYHQLCTRMARADYCGEGRSNTLDGTPISFRGPQAAVAMSPGGHLPKTVGAEGYALEAIWEMSDCGEVRPMCLGKARWDTLSLEATCVNRAIMQPTLMRRPCEDLNVSTLGGATMLVSYSLFIDRALVGFKSGETDYLTTTAVTVDLQNHPGGADVSGYSPDLDGNGVADVSSFVALRMEGPLLTPKLPANIRKRMGTLIKPLYRCANSHGRYLLTDTSTCDGATGYSLEMVNGDQGIEGFLYSAVDSDSPGQRRPLKLWKHSQLAGVFATSTQAPAGFVHVRDLGFLPSVGQLPGRDL
uniref:ADYC domain-containing protein n=1 Tax=Corallococcus coralloides TaxID=184914 RepID=UPI000FFE7A0B|nr:ADYC domain-containing protein [Corallococcus coralloides]